MKVHTKTIKNIQYVYFTPESKDDTHTLTDYEDGEGKMLAVPIKQLLRK